MRRFAVTPTAASAPRARPSVNASATSTAPQQQQAPLELKDDLPSSQPPRQLGSQQLPSAVASAPAVPSTVVVNPIERKLQPLQALSMPSGAEIYDWIADHMPSWRMETTGRGLLRRGHKLDYDKKKREFSYEFDDREEPHDRERRRGRRRYASNGDVDESAEFYGEPGPSLGMKNSSFGRLERTYEGLWNSGVTGICNMFSIDTNTGIPAGTVLGRAHHFGWEMDGDFKTTSGKGPAFFKGYFSSSNPSNSLEDTADVRATPAPGASGFNSLFADFVEYCNVFRYWRIESVEMEVVRPPSWTVVSAGTTNKPDNDVGGHGQNLRFKLHGWKGGPAVFSNTTAGPPDARGCFNPSYTASLDGAGSVDNQEWFDGVVPGPSIPWYAANTRDTADRAVCMTAEPIQPMQVAEPNDADIQVKYSPTPQVDVVQFVKGLVCLNSYGVSILVANPSPGDITFVETTPNSGEASIPQIRYKVRVVAHTFWGHNYFVSPGSTTDRFEELKVYQAKAMQDAIEKEDAEQKREAEVLAMQQNLIVTDIVVNNKKRAQAPPVAVDEDVVVVPDPKRQKL